MQFAKYSYEIRKIIENIETMSEEKRKESLDNLVRNVVAYAISNNNCKTNWTAQELFMDVIPDETIAELFNE